MRSAVKLAKSCRIAVPRIIFTYVDDCFAVVSDPPLCTGLRSNNSDHTKPAVAFNECLNAIHPRVQFTRVDEENQSIPFLDVLVTRDEGNVETEIYRKSLNTNIGLKPQS